MNSADNVLMIAYYFPPMGGAGVQRTLKFARYLPEFGWRPYILTVKDKSKIRDTSMIEELPVETSVTRTDILHLPSLLPWRLRNSISRWFLIVDEQIGWLLNANPAGQKIISRNNIKTIYSSSMPYTDHLIALHLHRRLHLPWVADFRDPWMGNPYLSFPTEFHRRINEKLEHMVFSEADRVILNTKRTQQYYLRKYGKLPPEKFVTIPNGYDQADIQVIDVDKPINPAFTIVHLGSLYRKVRSSEFFLAALQQAIAGEKIPEDNIRVRFIGNIDSETRGLVEQLELGKVVELCGYLNHRQALCELSSADLLLLIPSYGAGSELFVPAKLYEYLASNKPILCLSDPGEAADLVRKARAGTIVPPDDVIQIADCLVEMYHQWQEGQLKIQRDRQLIQTFERRRLTQRLAELFDEVSGKTR
jgi:glycosyltransferase involved in cell wall biosynthesis